MVQFPEHGPPDMNSGEDNDGLWSLQNEIHFLENLMQGWSPDDEMNPNLESSNPMNSNEMGDESNFQEHNMENFNQVNPMNPNMNMAQVANPSWQPKRNSQLMKQQQNAQNHFGGPHQMHNINQQNFIPNSMHNKNMSQFNSDGNYYRGVGHPVRFPNANNPRMMMPRNAGRVSFQGKRGRPPLHTSRGMMRPRGGIVNFTGENSRGGYNFRGRINNRNMRNMAIRRGATSRGRPSGRGRAFKAIPNTQINSADILKRFNVAGDKDESAGSSSLSSLGIDLNKPNKSSEREDIVGVLNGSCVIRRVSESKVPPSKNIGPKSGDSKNFSHNSSQQNDSSKNPMKYTSNTSTDHDIAQDTRESSPDIEIIEENLVKKKTNSSDGKSPISKIKLEKDSIDDKSAESNIPGGSPSVNEKSTHSQNNSDDETLSPHPSLIPEIVMGNRDVDTKQFTRECEVCREIFDDDGGLTTCNSCLFTSKLDIATHEVNNRIILLIR